MSNNEKTKLLSLEVVRCLAFLGVFISHANFSDKFSNGSGAWGVSVFLLMSGFLTIYNYYGSEKFDGYKFKDCFKFAYTKMKKIYPLHIITTILSFFIVIKGLDIFQIAFVSFKTLLNFLLIQEWIPFFQRSINGVSWYLCVAFLSYLLTPYVVNYINKHISARKAVLSIAVLFVFQIIICSLSIYLKQPQYADAYFDYDIYNWFIYKFPPIRLIDFLTGCNLGVIFLYAPNIKSVWCTFLEIISIFLSYLTCSFFGSLRLMANENNLNLICDKSAWFGPSVIFTLVSCLLIFSFAFGKGIISKILTNRFILFISKLSPYAFLIHSCVNKYIEYIIQTYTTNEYYLYYMCDIKLYGGFVITIILSYIYYLINKKVSHHIL